MYYSELKSCDIANGPGVRVVLFVSGCRHHCPGCFQPQTWDFTYGQPFTEQTVQNILNLMEPDYIAGLTLLGGEPMEPENQPVLLELVKQVRARYPQKTIWCFTGYTYETDLLAGRLGDPEITRDFLAHLDVLVDGEFIQEKKNLSLRFRGSENQRLIDLRKTEQAGQVVWWTDRKEGEKTCRTSV